MIDDGLIIMAVGMLVVFVFLAVMVVTIQLMSNFILNVFPEPEEAAPAKGLSAGITGGNDAEVALAIATAYMRS